MEHGYRLEIVIALTAETIAILALGAFLVLVDRWARELRERIVTRDTAATAAPTAMES